MLEPTSRPIRVLIVDSPTIYHLTSAVLESGPDVGPRPHGAGQQISPQTNPIGEPQLR